MVQILDPGEWVAILLSDFVQFAKVNAHPPFVGSWFAHHDHWKGPWSLSRFDHSGVKKLLNDLSHRFIDFGIVSEWRL